MFESNAIYKYCFLNFIFRVPNRRCKDEPVNENEK